MAEYKIDSILGAPSISDLAANGSAYEPGLQDEPSHEALVLMMARNRRRQ